MNINDFILEEIKALTLNDTVRCAQQVCENLPITHIPIVEGGKLIGCLPESDIQTIEDKDQKLSEYSYLLDLFYSNNKTTLLDLIVLFADNDCNLIPVLNQEMNYAGYYELSDVLDAFADSPFLHNESETLIIGKNGSGKTTILNILSGKDEADSGKVTYRKGLKVSFLAQEPELNDDLTIEESIFDSDNAILEVINSYHKALNSDTPCPPM